MYRRVVHVFVRWSIRLRHRKGLALCGHVHVVRVCELPHPMPPESLKCRCQHGLLQHMNTSNARPFTANANVKIVHLSGDGNQSSVCIAWPHTQTIVDRAWRLPCVRFCPCMPAEKNCSLGHAKNTRAFVHARPFCGLVVHLSCAPMAYRSPTFSGLALWQTGAWVCFTNVAARHASQMSPHDSALMNAFFHFMAFLSNLIAYDKIFQASFIQLYCNMK